MPPEEVEGKESLVHYIMDDVHIRHTMFAAVYLFRKRGILYLRTRTGSISRGGDFLRIDGYSQLFMMLEITMQGVFYGLGKRFLLPSSVYHATICVFP